MKEEHGASSLMELKRWDKNMEMRLPSSPSSIASDLSLEPRVLPQMKDKSTSLFLDHNPIRKNLEKRFQNM
jgi:hypothetical protein